MVWESVKGTVLSYHAVHRFHLISVVGRDHTRRRSTERRYHRKPYIFKEGGRRQSRRTHKDDNRKGNRGPFASQGARKR